MSNPHNVDDDEVEANYSQESHSERDSKYGVQFNNRSIRARFVRKVFILVTMMFAVVAVFSSLPLFHEDFGKWCRVHWWCQYIALIIFIVFYITLICIPAARRCFPLNLILLGFFTLSAAVMTMFIVAGYTAQSVLLTLCITVICSGSIILFATFTKYDLTTCMGIAFLLGIVVLAFGLVAIIFVLFLHWEFMMMIYSGLVALLMMFYLAIDIQLLMGGRRIELSPEEYIFAALQIFVDILELFLALLGIFGGRN